MESAFGGYDGLRLRPTTEEDREGIFQLRNHFEEAPLSPHALTDHLQSLNLEKQTRVVETSEGKLIGYAELLQRSSGWLTPQI